MAGIRAVMFDWRGTLVVDWPDDWWLRRAFAAIDRLPHPGEVDSMAEALSGAGEVPEVAAMLKDADVSAHAHRLASMAWYEAAGLDTDFALALYNLDFDAGCHPFAGDAEEVLRALRDLGVRIAVVSDIHLDLRPEFESAGLGDFVDVFTLSFEHGVCKPDAAIFETTVDALACELEQVLMVGDRSERDGGAVRLGIPTLLVPTLRLPQDRRLHLVGGLVSASAT
jgi:FMN phosphatase YigB (HAD superfamily)